MEWDVELKHIFVSPGHNFVGRHGKGAKDFEIEDRAAVECVAGRGIRDDRYFDHKENYKGQITFFDYDVYEAVKLEFNLDELEPFAFRRNVQISGVPLPELIGKAFTLQGLEFEGVEEAAPCYWMNDACAPGVEKFLKGRGGLRCRIRVGGELTRGEGAVSLLP